MEIWNKACMANHIWNICQPNTTSSWAAWAKVNLLHNKPLWEGSMPSICSWTWRKLLNLRNSFRHFIQHSIGNGRDTFLWFDYWLHIGPIHSYFGDRDGDRIIYDSGLPRYARVSDIIDGENWHWPIANSPDLIFLKNSILHDPQQWMMSFGRTHRLEPSL